MIDETHVFYHIEALFALYPILFLSLFLPVLSLLLACYQREDDQHTW